MTNASDTALLSRIGDTAFARLEAEGRLLNAVLKGPTDKPGRFGFRGELALKFAQRVADEARPPELSADQVIAVAESGAPTIGFLAAFLLSFESLQPLTAVLAGLPRPDGKYYMLALIGFWGDGLFGQEKGEEHQTLNMPVRGHHPETR